MNFPYSFWNNSVKGSSPSSLLNGLLVYYQLNGNANDVLNNYNLSISGNSNWCTGVVNSGYRQTGTTQNDYLCKHESTPKTSPFRISGNRTISVWVQEPSLPDNFYKETYLSKTMHTGNSDYPEWNLQSVSAYLSTWGAFNFSLNFSGATSTSVSTNISNFTTSNSGKWHLVVITSQNSGKSGSLCIRADNSYSPNNESVGEPKELTYNEASPIQSYVTDTPEYASFDIGGYTYTLGNGSINASYGPCFSNLDEVGIWNRILTSGEQTQLYNNGIGKTYPFA